MSGKIHDKRMPTKMSWGVLDHAIPIRRVLLDDCHGAQTVSSIDAVEKRVVVSAINAGPNGENSDDISCIGIKHDELTVTRGAE